MRLRNAPYTNGVARGMPVYRVWLEFQDDWQNQGPLLCLAEERPCRDPLGLGHKVADLGLTLGTPLQPALQFLLSLPQRTGKRLHAQTLGDKLWPGNQLATL